MIGVISTVEFTKAGKEALDALITAYNQEAIYVVHPFSRPYLDEMTAHCDKVLLCGKEALKLYFKVQKLEYAEMTQLWNNKAYHYVPHPNEVVKHPDNFRTLHDFFDYMVNTPSSEMVIPTAPDYTYVENPTMFFKLMDLIEHIKPDLTVLDIETTGRNIKLDDIRLVGIAIDTHDLYIIPSTLFNNQSVCNRLQQVIDKDITTWTSHNGNQFDGPWLEEKFGIKITFDYDTMLGNYTLDERQGVHSLDYIACGMFYIKSWKDMVEDYATVDEITLCNYLALDLHYQYKVADKLIEDIRASKGAERLHDEILIPVSKVFGKSYLNGIKCDVAYLVNLNTKQQQRISELTAELEEMVGPINVKSPQQVSDLLYNQLALTKKPSRNASNSCTDEISLVMLNNEVADKILQLKRYININNLFVKGLLIRTHEDERLRPSYRIHGTKTGRLSCSDPNLFNIPSPNHDWWDEDFNIKRAFIADEGNVLIEADESQVELRITAWYSRDEFLLNAYNNDEDIHTLVASMCYNIPISQVTKTMRQAAKKIDFGAIYEIGAQGLAEQLAYMKIFYTTKQVKQLQQNFLGKLVQFGKWKQGQYKLVTKNHFVDTPLGRVRRFPYITSRNLHEVLRQSVNMPIQSLAADITTSSIFELDALLPKEAKIHLSVYDSILMECPENMVDDVLPLIKKCMTQKNHLIEPRVPFKVDIKVGKSWGDMKEIHA